MCSVLRLLFAKGPLLQHINYLTVGVAQSVVDGYSLSLSLSLSLSDPASVFEKLQKLLFQRTLAVVLYQNKADTIWACSRISRKTNDCSVNPQFLAFISSFHHPSPFFFFFLPFFFFCKYHLVRVKRKPCVCVPGCPHVSLKISSGLVCIYVERYFKQLYVILLCDRCSENIIINVVPGTPL